MINSILALLDRDSNMRIYKILNHSVAVAASIISQYTKNMVNMICRLRKETNTVYEIDNATKNEMRKKIMRRPFQPFNLKQYSSKFNL